MTKRSKVLLVAMVLLLVAAYAVQRNERAATPDAGAGQALAPKVKPALNDITHFDIAGEFDHVTLHVVDGVWKVKEVFDYPANRDRVRQLMVRLGDARLKEQKTSKAEQYKALHLTKEFAKHLRVYAKGKERPISDIYIGKYSSGFGGSYVRRKGEEAVWLVSQDLSVDEAAMAWLDENLFNIERAEVRSVDIRRTKGDNLTISRAKPGDDFVVLQLPEGARVKSVFDLNMIASAFEFLKLQQVRHVSSTMGPKIQEVTFTTFSGLEVVSEFFLLDKSVWTKITAHYNEDSRAAYLKAVVHLGDAKQFEKNLTPVDEVKKQAELINAKTSDWYYMLSQQALEQLRKRQEDVLTSDKDTPAPSPKK